ncbi:hypothetical protein [Anaeroselena agilis]|uniref:Uncharacterized protein n=1 Tax=Anaeroselena agilis TaxID=3063788 RepID=A0ABU3NZK0_9FIRM|nr:hypothetical protein [Selenomonadales bacterium 4137-cl]
MPDQSGWIHRYFVSYYFLDGFGCLEIIRKQAISNFDDIHEICNLIEQEKGYTGVVLLNYQLLRSDWIGKGGIENVQN